MAYRISVARDFPRFTSVTCNCLSFDWFTVLFATFVIGSVIALNNSATHAPCLLFLTAIKNKLGKSATYKKQECCF